MRYVILFFYPLSLMYPLHGTFVSLPLSMYLSYDALSSLVPSLMSLIVLLYHLHYEESTYV